MEQLHAYETPIITNPFASTVSRYSTFDGEKLLSAKPVSPFHAKAHDAFRQYVTRKDFACVAGQTALHNNHYAFGAYDDMTSAQTAEGLCHDLFRFKKDFQLKEKIEGGKIPFASFIASFENPHIENELQSVGFLYTLLYNMFLCDQAHDIDWNPNISNDIGSVDFSYSNGGDAFFIPFLHPHASSEARQFPIPTVVFNAHVIFERLRKIGAFENLKKIIRGRQKHIHPALGNFGETTEWDQYGLRRPGTRAIG